MCCFTLEIDRELEECLFKSKMAICSGCEPSEQPGSFKHFSSSKFARAVFRRRAEHQSITPVLLMTTTGHRSPSRWTCKWRKRWRQDAPGNECRDPKAYARSDRVQGCFHPSLWSWGQWPCHPTSSISPSWVVVEEVGRSVGVEAGKWGRAGGGGGWRGGERKSCDYTWVWVAKSKPVRRTCYDQLDILCPRNK